MIIMFSTLIVLIVFAPCAYLMLWEMHTHRHNMQRIADAVERFEREQYFARPMTIYPNAPHICDLVGQVLENRFKQAA